MRLPFFKKVEIYNPFDDKPTRIRPPLTAWIVLVLSLALTAAGWYISYRVVQKRAQDRFNFRTQDLIVAVSRRVAEYEQVLRGGVGFLNATYPVSRKQWADYVVALRIRETYPDIQHIGFSLKVDPKDLNHHIHGVQQEGFPHYVIWPPGERSEYHTVIFHEPVDAHNQRTFGYDMFFNPARRPAMERARDTGLTSMTGKVQFVRENEREPQTGFVLYLPVYRKGAPLQTVEDRRSALVGFVFSPFQTQNLMEGILDPERSGIDFEIYDGTEVMKDSMIYRSNPRLIADSSKKPPFSKTISLALAGRSWTIYVSSKPKKTAVADNLQTYLFALSGILVDILLFIIITSIHFQKRKTEQANRELTEVNRIKSEFTSMVSHELRTPLHAIQEGIEMVTDGTDGPLTAAQEQTLGLVRRNIHRLSRLINSVLEFSRLEYGKLRLNFESTDLHALITDSFNLMQLSTQKRNLKFVADMPEGAVNVFCDRDKIQQVLLNLIDNATKFTPENGVVTVRLKREGNLARVEVEDTGIGIPKEDQDKLFKMFSQASYRGMWKTGGSGIGLAVCKVIIEQHRGEIFVESEADKGSKFIFTLPAIS